MNHLEKVLGVVAVAMMATLTGCAAETSSEDPTTSGEENLTRTPDEKAVIAAVKAGYEPSLNNQKTLLNFKDTYVNGTLNIKNGFAYVIAAVQLPDGSEPSVKGTVYEKGVEEGWFDGFHVEALLKKNGDAWVALDVALGGTDSMCTADVSSVLGAPMPKGLTDCATSAAPSERTQILDAARAFLGPKLKGQAILFNFSEAAHVNTDYKVIGNYAHIIATVQLANGKEPSIKGTDYEALENEGVFDGPHFEAVLKKGAKGWKVLEGSYGGTDSMCGGDIGPALGEPIPAGLTACD